MLEKDRKTPRKKTAAPKGAPAKTGSAPAFASTRPAGATAPGPTAGAAARATAGATERPGRGALSQEERRRMIAESAYYRAQRRGFHAGDPNRDWIEAEAEIDAMLILRR